MKITAVETIQVAEYSNLVWVELHTDEGLVGLGETFRSPAATVAYIHATSAPYLLDPPQIERRPRPDERGGKRFMGSPSRSVEVRGTSAIDLGLWDLFGKAAGLPLWQLLGGLCRDTISIYNTCASAGYYRMVRAGTNSLLLGPRIGRRAAIPWTTSPHSTSARPRSRARCSRAPHYPLPRRQVAGSSRAPIQRWHHTSACRKITP